MAASLTDAYLQWYLDEHPVAASLAGAPGYGDRLGDLTAADFERRERDRDRWLDRLTAVEPDGSAEQIDRELIIAMLRGERVLAGWPSWRRDPSGYLGLIFAALHTPLLHRLHSEPELAKNAAALLGQVPEALAACRANLDPELAAPLLVRRGIRQARAGRGFVTQTLLAMFTDASARTTVADAAETAAVAFDDTVAFLEAFAEQARGDWRMGEPRYSALLQDRELLGYGAAQLADRGRVAWAGLDAEMRELATRVPRGGSDWRVTMEALQADHPPTLEAMREEYAAEADRARAFLVEHRLVTFPDGEQCRVVPAPEFQRAVLSVASYVSPPALSDSRIGHFFVPFTLEGARAEEITGRLRSNARAQLPTVTVHEAYPGHHWQLSWMAGMASPVRRLLRTSYFAEGWALYAEAMLREHGYFTEPAHELAHLDARIFRAARIVVDVGLHCGELTVAQAEEYMTRNASLTPQTARGEVERYCAWPTQAPSYLTGALEIEAIRADYLASDRGGLREFHDALGGSGCLPLGLARRAVLDSERTES